MLLFILVFIIFNISSSTKVIPVKNPENPVITFGSCLNLHKHPNPPIFQYILKQNSDVWIWIGDIAYFPPNSEDGEKMVNSFNNVKNLPFYNKLRKTIPIIGMWDDHDYGQNNGDKNYKHKERNKQFYLDFLDEPLDSPRKTRDGLYESYYIGDEKKVKVILLDVRYNKDAPSIFGGGDMLGETQWKWLEEEIKNNKAEFTLIASGSQVLTDDRIFIETWYEASRQRLFELIRKYKLSGVILLSGDVHFAEILKHPCPERIGYNLYELTSSGLTESPPFPEPERLVKELFLDTYNSPKDRVFQRNFGVLRFSFGEENFVIFEIRNEKDELVLEKRINSHELQFKEEIIDLSSTCIMDTNPYWRLIKKNLFKILSGDFFVVKYALTHVRSVMHHMDRKLKSIIILIAFGVFVAILIFLFRNKAFRNLLKKIFGDKISSQTEPSGQAKLKTS